MNLKKTKYTYFIAGALVVSLASAIPALAQSSAATKADIQRIDREVELLKKQVGQIQILMNQHSKPAAPANEPGSIGVQMPGAAPLA